MPTKKQMHDQIEAERHKEAIAMVDHLVQVLHGPDLAVALKSKFPEASLTGDIYIATWFKALHSVMLSAWKENTDQESRDFIKSFIHINLVHLIQDWNGKVTAKHKSTPVPDSRDDVKVQETGVSEVDRSKQEEGSKEVLASEESSSEGPGPGLQRREDSIKSTDSGEGKV